MRVEPMPLTSGAVQLLPVHGLPEIGIGADLGALIVSAFKAEGDELAASDIVVVTHKIVAKAEGALVNLRDITPTPVATAFAERWGKDPRHIELVLRQSTRLVRMDRGVIIAETHHGLVCANAGVDQSNVVGEDMVCVLPDDPDASAARVRASVQALTGLELGVIVCDTFGRPSLASGRFATILGITTRRAGHFASPRWPWPTSWQAPPSW
jgi:coenzyme F420-0:L-glutamate ligase / coenzyme F420-1:gamma-L-glutamate ligase